MQAIVNPLYPSRIQLSLGSLTGPLTSTALGAFDPRIALEIYAAGLPVSLLSFSFDETNDRYLLFTSVALDTTQIIQIIHHLPAAPYTGSNGTLPGFALIALVNATPDTVTPRVGLYVPATNVEGTTIPFTWNAVGVAQIEITTTSGYNSGLIAADRAAGVVYAKDFPSSGNYMATIAAFDGSGNPIAVNGQALTASTSLVITTS